MLAFRTNPRGPAKLTADALSAQSRTGAMVGMAPRD
jgi:hypothetical protein